jgi:hypothetical protein
MIRIDENTYIDDTLVTCAEYQLFIDEMRDQGKYYQPDHWTSYKFPEGRARAPIVGVRFSDVVAFCEWLNQREPGQWSFCLPTALEAEKFRLLNPYQSNLGYWGVGRYSEAKFIWICPITNNPRNLDLTHIWARIHEFASNISTDITINLDRALDLDSSFASAEKLAGDFFLVTNLDHTLVPILAHSQGLAHDLFDTLDLALIRDMGCPRDIVSILGDLDRNILRLPDPPNLVGIKNRASTLDRALSLTLASLPDSSLILTRLRSTSFPEVIDNALKNIRDLSVRLDLFIDIYTLQERIAGRSPAFEGIRLVKERKP